MNKFGFPAAILVVFSGILFFLGGFFGQLGNNEIDNVVVVTKIVEVKVEVPVETEKEKVLVFFGNKSSENEIIPEPTPKPITQEYVESGEWSDLPFDQNNDGKISCSDFLGLDNLLDLAYNRYNLGYLDGNDDGVPCNE